MKKSFFIIFFMLTALCFADDKRALYITPSAGGMYCFDPDYPYGLGFTGSLSVPLSKHFDIHGTAGCFFFNPQNMNIFLPVATLGFDYIFHKNFKLGFDISLYPGISFTLFEYHKISINLAQFSDFAVTYGFSIPIRLKSKYLASNKYF